MSRKFVKIVEHASWVGGISAFLILTGIGIFV